MKLQNRLNQKVKCCSETDVRTQSQSQKCEKRTNIETICQFNSLRVCEFQWRRNEKRATIQKSEKRTDNVKQNDELRLTTYTQAFESILHRDDRIVVALCYIVEQNSSKIYIL